MIKLKTFINLYAYGEGFDFDVFDPIQAIDVETGAHFRLNENDIPLLGGDLIPGLTTKEAVLNKAVKYFDNNVTTGEIEVYI